MQYFKTPCCKVGTIRLSRMYHICSKCKEDVSMDLFLYMSADLKEEE